MAEGRHYPNKLGIAGWAFRGRWGVDRYLYILHRITGLGLLLYFLLHIIVTTSRAFGPEAWKEWMDTFARSWIGYGEYLVFLAFAFHAFNGARLVIIELFGGVGRPIEPIYPYKTSLNTQRPLMVIIILIIIAVVVVGSYDFFVHTKPLFQ
jgi:succinate dehydrogenase / fumarate reductase cytochrome b subunit